MLHYTSNIRSLEDIIFDKFNVVEHDEFIALSAYLGVSPIRRLEGLNCSSKVIFGLASEGVNMLLHNKLTSVEENVNIYVPTIPSHAKIYAWKLKGEIKCLLNGSSNFSHRGLNTPFREVLEEVHFNSFPEYSNYLNQILSSSVLYAQYRDPIDYSMDLTDSARGEYATKCESASIYGAGSKINWGHAANGNVNKRDSYISITSPMINDYPDLFPEKAPLRGLGYNDNEPIDIIWDDGEEMLCLLEGTVRKNIVNPITGLIEEKRFPNKIASYPSKRILGDYLRSRLDVSPGVFVTEQMLNEYGRNSITISKKGDVYFLDFSRKT